MRELVVLGNVNVDLILGPLGAWPSEGTERGVWRVGGNAGNAAVALAALGVLGLPDQHGRRGPDRRVASGS
ncbi:hypothetical protein [Deinococcus aestuarii]|uniref:hypothetical protein n=1 Tax=Deinococcus aestuarii TaxID=2774531 RepID=UPI001FE3F222|nr:hypothetical protein [Deinococcus aestuarii]